MSKKTFPYDYGFGLDMFIQFLKFMQTYYQEDINVHTLEVEGYESRLDGITHALNEYDAYLHVSDSLQLPTEIVGDVEVLGKIYKSPEQITGIETNNTKEELEEVQRKETEHWNNFWNIVRDNMLTWWD